MRYQSGPITPVQAAERQHADLRLAGPGRLELGAERHDQQHRHLRSIFNEALNNVFDPLPSARLNGTLTVTCFQTTAP